MSKGGLLYHFPSKDALVWAMAAERVDALRSQLDGYREANPAATLLEAYVATIDADQTDMDAAVLIAAAEQPRRGADVRADFAALLAQVTDGLTDPVLGDIVRLAADALWLTSLLHLDQFDDHRRDAVIGRLVELARRADSEDPPE